MMVFVMVVGPHGVGCWFNQLGYWLTMMVFVAVSYSSQISIYDGCHGCGGHDKTIALWCSVKVIVLVMVVINDEYDVVTTL